jgi:hypothetical protein
MSKYIVTQVGIPAQGVCSHVQGECSHAKEQVVMHMIIQLYTGEGRYVVVHTFMCQDLDTECPVLKCPPPLLKKKLIAKEGDYATPHEHIGGTSSYDGF